MPRLNLSDQPQSSPVPDTPQVTPPSLEHALPPWSTVFLFAVVIGLLIYIARGHSPGPGPNPGPITERYVLMVEGTEDRASLPIEKVDAMTSLKFREACKARNVQYRKFIVGQDVSNDDPIFEKLLNNSKGPYPSIMFGGENKFREEPLTTEDEAMNLLNKHYPEK